MSAHLHPHRRSRHRQDEPHLLHGQSTGRLKHAAICRELSGIRGGQVAPLVSPLGRGLVIHQDPAGGRAQDKIGPALHMLPFGRGPCDWKFDHGDGIWPTGRQPRAQRTQLVVERRLTHHCHIVETDNESYRFLHSTAVAKKRIKAREQDRKGIKPEAPPQTPPETA